MPGLIGLPQILLLGLVALLVLEWRWAAPQLDGAAA